MSNPTQPSLHIALLGTRGVPARYGGFETFAEEIALRLVERGHKVTVYGRCPFFSTVSRSSNYKGILTRDTPTIFHKYLETPVHAITSFFDLFRRKVDVVLLCNAANSPFAWLARMRGIPVVINVDGIERRRSKWNFLGRTWYRVGELCSVLFASAIVSDAETIAQYYQRTYLCTSEVIPYGAIDPEEGNGSTLEQFGLKRGSYLLYVSRLEPENNALGVIEAYRKVETDLPLVIVGDAPYADEYKARLRAAADERVVFTGFQFEEAYRELRKNCLIAVQAHEVGGAHPTLIEAMAAGNCIVANGVPEHFEVLGGAGVYYHRNDFGSLAQILRELLSAPDRVKSLQQLARRRAEEVFQWDTVCESYEQLLRRVVLSGRSGVLSGEPVEREAL